MESIKKYVIKDSHGNIKQQGALSVVGDVEISVDGDVGTPTADAVYDNGVLKITLHDIKGNGIAIIDVEESDEDGGENVVTITDSLGNITTFRLKNGETGGQGPQGVPGPQGDTVLVNPGDVVVTDYLGQSSTKAMSQKGVTDILSPMEDLTSELDDGFYTGNVGQKPTKNTQYGSQYISLRTTVTKGDAYSYNLQSSASGKCWLKLKDGVITEKSPESSNTAASGIVKCDGTFDELIFNTQGSYGSKSIIVSTPMADSVEELKMECQKLNTQKDIRSSMIVGYYATTVGEAIAAAPNTSQGENFKSYRTSVVYPGVSYDFNLASGGTGRCWAKIKDGIIIETSSEGANQTNSGTVVCDGTFDELVFNSSSSSIKVLTLNRVIPSLVEDGMVFSACDRIAANQKEIAAINAYMEGTMPYNDMPLPRNPEELKILAIGNSLTQNTFANIRSFMSNIGLGEKLTYGLLVNSSQSLAGEVTAFDNNSSAGNLYYSLRGAAETTTNSVTIQRALDYDNWDIVILQQVSSSSANMSSYSSLYELVKRIRLYTKNRPKICFNLTWSTTNQTAIDLGGEYKMYLALREVARMLRYRYKIDILIPQYQAMEQVRLDPVSEDMNDLLSDGLHANGYGEVVVGLTLIESLIGVCFNKSIGNITSRGQYITDDNAADIIRCVRTACAYPLEILEPEEESEL